MHGFVGCVERDAEAAGSVCRWLRRWTQVGAEKACWQAEAPPFRYVGSAEPAAPGRPTAADGDGRTLVYDGFICRDQLADQEDRRPRTQTEVAEALLRLYREEGAESLAALNGRYVVAVWDAPADALYITNDALGLKPVLTWQWGASFIFASNPWPIACHPAFQGAIESRGVIDLLLLSHQQGDRTLLRDISVLPPGSVTTVSDGRVESRVVRNLEFSRDRWDWSIEHAAEEMRRLLEQSVRRRVGEEEELILPLSGGFDSRVLLGFLLGMPGRIDAVTQFQHGLYAEDTRYAKRLARAAGVRHTVVPYSDDFLARSREKCVAISGGMYDIHTGRHFSWLPRVNGTQRPVVSAHLGGELTSRFQISDTAFRTPEEHWQQAFQSVNEFRFPPDTVRSMLAAGQPDDLVDAAVDENRRFFMSQGGAFFHRFYHWDLLLSRRRYISFQLFYFDQLTRVFAPFYDLDFIDFVCSLPFAAIHRQHAYRAMLRDAFPELAKIPNTNDLPVLTSTKEVLRDFAATQYRRFVQKPLRRVLPLRRWIGHPMKHYGFALQGDSRAVLDHIMDSREKMSPYLDPDGVEAAVQRQLDGDNSTSMGLLGLSAFATTLDMLEDPYAAVRAWE